MNLPPGNRARIEMAGAGSGLQYNAPLSDAEKDGGTKASGDRTGYMTTNPTASLSHVNQWEIRQQGFRRVYNFYPATNTAASASVEKKTAPEVTGCKVYDHDHDHEHEHHDDAAHSPIGTGPATDTAPIPEHTFTWKGSHSVLSSLPGSAAEGCGEMQAALPECHGNLKLVDSRGKVLAAWRQQRGKKVLGMLYVFDDEEEEVGKGKVGPGGLDIDVVVATCLYVVIVERILWTTFVGS